MAASTKLSTVPGIKEYFRGTIFACTDVEELSGGYSNYSFRLKLSQSYQGRETVVLKHAQSFSKAFRDFSFDVKRQIYEVAALRQVKSWLPDDSIVTVPEVLHFDEAEHGILMEDAGIGSMNLKAFMQEGRATPMLADKIGVALGAFLARLHRWGRGNVAACEAVKGNQEAKEITAWFYFGRITQTLRGAVDTPPKLTDPPLVIEESDLEVLGKLENETRNAMLAVKDNFVQGDYWPGNIMIALDEAGDLKRIYVLDWEGSKAGLPGIDVGQFSAEVHLLRRFHPDTCGETATILLDSFLREYKRIGNPVQEDMRFARLHLGAHLIVLTARVPWGEKELTRNVVQEGVRIILDGSNLLDAGDPPP